MIFLFLNAWKYAQKDRWKIVVFCILHSMSFVGELIQPYAFGKAINVLQTNGTQDLYQPFRWLGVYLIGFFGFQIFHHSARYFEVTTGRKNQQRFMNAVYDKIYRLPIQWHKEHHTGSVVNRIKVAGEALRDFSCAINTYLRHLFLCIGPIVILLGFSWKIALISLVLTSLNLFIVTKINNKIQLF